MSTIGKVFLFLNLVLAAAFLGWSATSLSKNAEFRKKYQEEVAAHGLTKDALGKEKTDLVNQLNQLKTDKGAVEDQRDQAKAMSDRNKADLDEARRAGDQMRGELTKVAETLGGIKQDIVASNTAKDRAVQEARDAERDRDAARGEKDKADLARRDAEDKARVAEAKIVELEKNLVASNKKSSQLDTELATLMQATGVSAKELGAGQPKIDGAVLQIDYTVKPGLVAINKGEKAGVKRGFVFDIYNGTQYKGRARVENVRPDMCSALIIFAVGGTTVSQGDAASTSL